MHLEIGLALVAAAVLLSGGLGWSLGRQFPSSRRLEEVYSERLDRVYDRGWDDSALAHAALSTGTGAAADEIPAPAPASSMICPGGRRCIRGPEPHQWSADCEEDEGWSDRMTEANKRGLSLAEYDDLAEDDDATAKWLHTMRTELAAEEERPATDTEQFRAVFSRADGLERQYLLTWDAKRRYDKGRPDYLREMGVSEKRIRQLLGAE